MPKNPAPPQFSCDEEEVIDCILRKAIPISEICFKIQHLNDPNYRTKSGMTLLKAAIQSHDKDDFAKIASVLMSIGVVIDQSTENLASQYTHKSCLQQVFKEMLFRQRMRSALLPP